MADWQEAVQASVIAIIFAFMVAKLVSVVISFRGENLRVERGGVEEEQEQFISQLLQEDDEDGGDSCGSSDSDNWDGGHPDAEEKVWEEASEKAVPADDTEEESNLLPEKAEEDSGEIGNSPRNDDVGLRPLVQEPAASDENLIPGLEKVKDEDEVAAELKPVPTAESYVKDTEVAKNEGDGTKIQEACGASGEVSDSEEWEGVESSELEETFGAAATLVATQATGSGLKLPNETQLLLYGLYKVATEGTCSTPQPLAYKMSARAKWNAWQKLGNIGQEEAMHRYIAVVSEINPSWAQGNQKTDKRAQDTAGGDASQRGGMGPVFSSLVMNEEGVEEEGTLEPIHICAREGDQAGLLHLVENGTDIDLKDSDGRTALHWAADRGHLQAVELLLAKGAQIHAKDAEGQTALHYATTCEQEEIAKFLVTKGADPSMQDNDGVSPVRSRPAHWLWMGGTT